jgi:hypothetical protein
MSLRLACLVAGLCAVVAPACGAGQRAGEARPSGTAWSAELCTAAWNRGLHEGAPGPAGSVYIATAGIQNGFVARRASVGFNAGTCRVAFDFGSYTYAFASAVADPEPAAAWVGDADVEAVSDGFADWNACQNDDGTVALGPDGACLPHDPRIQPRPILEELERAATEAFAANASYLAEQGAAGYWLGPRFAGAVARPVALGPAGADLGVEYRVVQTGEVVTIGVLTFAPPPAEVPQLDIIAEMGGDAQTVLIVRVAGPPVGPELAAAAQAALTSDIPASEEPQPAPPLPPASSPAEQLSLAAGAFGHPVYWLGPEFRTTPAIPAAVFPPGTVFVSYFDYPTVVRVVTATADGRRDCLASASCPVVNPVPPVVTHLLMEVDVPGPTTVLVFTDSSEEPAAKPEVLRRQVARALREVRASG